jgi:hypothetical protein
MYSDVALDWRIFHCVVDEIHQSLSQDDRVHYHCL